MAKLPAFLVFAVAGLFEIGPVADEEKVEKGAIPTKTKQCSIKVSQVVQILIKRTDCVFLFTPLQYMKHREDSKS